MQVREFLHPQVDEIVDTLPTWLGHPLSRSRTFQRVVHAATHKGMILNTNSVAGYTLLTTMARVRPLRPRSVRYAREQAAINQWTGQAARRGPHRPGLATEIIACQRVLKGYGETHHHGCDSFDVLMDAARRLLGSPGAAARLAELRAAALGDEDGAALQGQRRRAPGGVTPDVAGTGYGAGSAAANPAAICRRRNFWTFRAAVGGSSGTHSTRSGR